MVCLFIYLYFLNIEPFSLECLNINISNYWNSLGFFEYWLTLITLIIIIFSLIRFYLDSFLKKNSSLRGLFILNLFIVLSIIFRNNLLTFYILFEISVFPIFLIILGWGYQPEKFNASYAIFFYTLCSAIPLIIFILFIELKRIYWIFYRDFSFFNESSLFIFIRTALSLRFLVKIPIFLFHIWLPIAHVEAPVFGSIVLAGILLKLGGIGLIRFSFFFNSILVPISLSIVSLIGFFYVRFICIKITDLKSVIAYSSVRHIAFVILTIFRFSKLRFISRNFIIIRHAFRSSGL